MKDKNTKNSWLTHKNTFKVLILILTFFLYGNSISNNYSLDDDLVTTTDRDHHPLVEKGYQGLHSIFTSNYASNSNQNYEYRPISTYSFALEWSLFGNSEHRAPISHFINVLLYAILGIKILELLQKMLGKESDFFSFCITALFLAHPIHTEVVNSLKNRDEILSLLFSVLALIAAFNYIDHKKVRYLIALPFLFLLAILSKKTAMPFLVIIPMAIYFFRTTNWKILLSLSGLIILGRLLFTLMNKGLLNEPKNRAFLFIENPLFGSHLYERIPQFFYTNFLYIQQLLLPYDLNFYYGYNAIPIVNYTSVSFMISLILMLIWIGFALYKFKQKSLYSFGILFFFLAIGGASNLIYPMVGIYAERLAFTASLGFIIAFTYLLFLLFKVPLTAKITALNKNKLPYLLLLLLTLSSFAVIKRNPAWESKKSLYQSDMNDLKSSAKANSLMGQEYQYESMQIALMNPIQIKEIIKTGASANFYYSRALKVYPNYTELLNNQASLQATVFLNPLAARQLFNKAISIDSNYLEGHEHTILNEIAINKLYQRVNNIKNIQTNLSDQKKFSRAEFIKILSIIVQFETMGKKVLSSGLRPESIKYTVQYAEQLQLNYPSSTLNEIDFAHQINISLNDLYSGRTKSGENILDPLIRKLCEISNYKKETNDTEIVKSLHQLKKINYLKYFSLAENYFIVAAKYSDLISLEQQYITKYPRKSHVKPTIQIANAYFNLQKPKKSLYYFEQAISMLQTEQDQLKGSEMETKKDSLAIEINRLNQFIGQIKVKTKK